MDVGWAPDLSAVLFGYWHFERALLVIEGEFSIGSMTTDELAAGIKATEERLWGDYWRDKLARGIYTEEAQMRPLRRLSDTALQVIYDLSKLHGLHFDPISKVKGDGERAFKEAAINQTRQIVKHEQIRISPDCPGLISHLKAGVWNKSHTSYDRIEGFGHFDYIDSLVYLVRNLDRQRDPSPGLDPSTVTDDTHIRAHRLPPSPEQVLGDIFTPKLS